MCDSRAPPAPAQSLCPRPAPPRRPVTSRPAGGWRARDASARRPDPAALPAAVAPALCPRRRPSERSTSLRAPAVGSVWGGNYVEGENGMREEGWKRLRRSQHPQLPIGKRFPRGRGRPVI